MKKTYSSKALRFTVNIKIDGNPVAIEFLNFDQEAKRLWFETSDPVIQEQLESNPAFKVYFRLDRTEKEEGDKIVDAPEVPEVVSKEQIIKRNLTEAKQWLNSIGVAYNKMKSKDIVVALAFELGYVLIFESDNK